MTWELISVQERFAFLLFVFFFLCAQLFYLIRSWDNRRRKRWKGMVLCFCLLFAEFYLLHEERYLVKVPVLLLWGAAAVCGGFVVRAILSDVKSRKKQISRASIRESMDNLPVAGCYFNREGRVKLCNRQMYRIYHMMTREDLQTLSELQTALKLCEAYGVRKMPDGGYLFPDGRIRYYLETEMTAVDGNRYTEAIFTDATELAAANRELRMDNRELERINIRLEKMYARAEQDIREQEYLTFKMKVHDEIGRSLAVIRRVLQKELPDADMEKQVLDLLHSAGNLLDTSEIEEEDALEDSYDRLLKEAAQLGVEIRLEGTFPADPLIYELIVRAIRECVTNCVRHAHGCVVFVRIQEDSRQYLVMIHNDGERPQGQPAEGGGLSNLRRCVESSGAEMTVFWRPAFLLKLIFDAREEVGE